MERKQGALLVIVMIGALIVLVTWLSIDRWQSRVNPSVVNQQPSTSGPPAATGT